VLQTGAITMDNLNTSRYVSLNDLEGIITSAEGTSTSPSCKKITRSSTSFQLSSTLAVVKMKDPLVEFAARQYHRRSIVIYGRELNDVGHAADNNYAHAESSGSSSSSFRNYLGSWKLPFDVWSHVVEQERLNAFSFSVCLHLGGKGSYN
jgi:hypothetical protein